MITQQKIDDVVDWTGLKDFSRFVLSHCENGHLPDYKNMDLMQIPRLMPHIWVYDLRDDPSGDVLLVNFCGGIINDTYGRNMMGDHVASIYEDDSDWGKVVKLYSRSVQEKLVAYTRRYAHIQYSDGSTKWRYTEALFIPCSSNGREVNWGIGCTNFDLIKYDGENIFNHL